MLDRVEVDVFHTSIVIHHIPDGVLVEPWLPDPGPCLARELQHRISPVQLNREVLLYRLPTARVVRILFRQCPDGVEVLWQNNHRIDSKGSHSDYFAKHRPKQLNVIHQKCLVSIGQDNSKEVGPALHTISAIQNQFPPCQFSLRPTHPKPIGHARYDVARISEATSGSSFPSSSPASCQRVSTAIEAQEAPDVASLIRATRVAQVHPAVSNQRSDIRDLILVSEYHQQSKYRKSRMSLR